LFDATEAAQMEERVIMTIVRNAAPYFVCAFRTLLGISLNLVFF
jgi:hypothetical protein